MARLEKTRYVPHLIVLAAISLTFVMVARPRQLRGNPEGPIPLTLPTSIGIYKGEDLYFCQNDQCAAAFSESELTRDENGEPQLVCSFCESELSMTSIGENKMLPKNTPIFRKIYSAPRMRPIQCTIVFSGGERMSIHRPQVCLVSQGNRIVNEYNYDVKVSREARMPLRVIDMVQEYTNAQGERVAENAIYAYWFFNPERETPSHFTRLVRMAYDNAFRGYRPRWAYVSIAMYADAHNPDSYRAILDEFVPLLYPVTEELRREFRRMEQDGATTTPPLP